MTWLAWASVDGDAAHVGVVRALVGAETECVFAAAAVDAVAVSALAAERLEALTGAFALAKTPGAPVNAGPVAVAAGVEGIEIVDVDPAVDLDEDLQVEYGQREDCISEDLAYMQSHSEPVAHGSLAVDVAGPNSSFGDAHCFGMQGENPSEAEVYVGGDEMGPHSGQVVKQSHASCAGRPLDSVDAGEGYDLEIFGLQPEASPYHRHRHHLGHAGQ